VKSIEDYTVEDFLDDPHFIKWVSTPDLHSTIYWNSIIEHYPQKKQDVMDARRLWQAMQAKPLPVSEIALSNLKANIFDRIELSLVQEEVEDNGQAKTKPSFVKYWMLAAAIGASIAVVGIFLVDSRQVAPEGVRPDIAISTVNLEEQIVPKGRRTMMELQDGTTIWLNSDTRIEYNKDFMAGTTREVYLKGEAYFKVAPDKSRPFIVHTENVSIRVLGTSFNVKAYDNDSRVETTLVEGKIMIQNKAQDGKIDLSPNQRAVFSKKKQNILIENYTRTENYTSWKNGVLTFEDEPMREIIPVLERWYNVAFHVADNAMLDCQFTAKVNNKSLEEVLELFKASEKITYRIEGRQVFLSGRFCE
jgi:ferric-dicitrate binding protein FerR (iron transport regulator)